MAEERIGPGLYRRRAGAPTTPSPTAESAEAASEREPKPRFTQPHEMKASLEQRVLDHWSAVIGVVPQLLREQAPVLVRQWGVDRLKEAVDLVAQRRPKGRRIDSRQTFGALLVVLRAWKRAEKK